MLEWIGYILARIIAGVITALILNAVFHVAKFGGSKEAGIASSMA